MGNIIHLPDGTTLNFPEGTSVEDMQSATDSYMSQRLQKTQQGAQSVEDQRATLQGIGGEAAAFSGLSPAEITPEEIRRNQIDWSNMSGRQIAQGIGSIGGGLIGAAGPVLAAPETGGVSLAGTGAGVVAGSALGDAIGGQAYDLGKSALEWLRGENTAPLTGWGQGEKAANDLAWGLGTGAIGDRVIPLAIRAADTINSPFRSYFLRGALNGSSSPGAIGQLVQDYVNAGMTPTPDAIFPGLAILLSFCVARPVLIVVAVSVAVAGGFAGVNPGVKWG